jgi:hypothetical protein
MTGLLFSFICEKYYKILKINHLPIFYKNYCAYFTVKCDRFFGT